MAYAVANTVCSRNGLRQAWSSPTMVTQGLHTDFYINKILEHSNNLDRLRQGHAVFSSTCSRTTNEANVLKLHHVDGKARAE